MRAHGGGEVRFAFFHDQHVVVTVGCTTIVMVIVVEYFATDEIGGALMVQRCGGGEGRRGVAVDVDAGGGCGEEGEEEGAGTNHDGYWFYKT